MSTEAVTTENTESPKVAETASAKRWADVVVDRLTFVAGKLLARGQAALEFSSKALERGAKQLSVIQERLKVSHPVEQPKAA